MTLWFQPCETLSRETSPASPDFWATELWDNKCMLAQASKFVIICYNSSKKHLHLNVTGHMLPGSLTVFFSRAGESLERSGWSFVLDVFGRGERRMEDLTYLTPTQYTAKTMLYISPLQKWLAAASWGLKRKQTSKTFVLKNLSFLGQLACQELWSFTSSIWWSIVFRGRERMTRTSFAGDLSGSLRILQKRRARISWKANALWKGFSEMKTTEKLFLA